MRPPAPLALAFALALPLAFAAAPACAPAAPMVSAPLLVATAAPDAGPAVTDAAPIDLVRPPHEGPFRPGDHWTGTYVCGQGTTELVLRITDVQGNEIEAVFDFHHDSSGAEGSFQMSGTYVPASRRLKLTAGEWIEQPPNYITVDLDGRVDGSNESFAGRVLAAGCGAFTLRK